MLNIRKVYGPYSDSTKTRRIVQLFFNDGTSKTMSNARWLMTQKLGRWLTKEETVDHDDGNPLNDDLSNLKIMSLADNIRKSAKPAGVYKFNCPVCKKFVEKPLRDVKHNRKNGKAGPFCGKHCSRMWQLENDKGYNRKLKSLDVKNIRKDLEFGQSTRSIAKRYNMNIKSIQNIKAGRTWGKKNKGL